MENEVINLKDIWFKYNGLTALEGINLSVKEGDFLGIIGPNGGGKTTLFKIILGLIKPGQGTVEVLGENPEKTRKYIGYVPQYPVLDRDFPASVWDVALMGRLGYTGLFKKYTRKDKKITADVLNKVEMYNLKQKQISKLSWGQMQRVLIARALATEPKILLLDEPTASIDSHIKIELYELLLTLNSELTIVLVTHDIGVLSSYIKKIACLNRKLIYHESREISTDMLEEAYHCPVDILAHGIPHRVLAEHREDEKQ